MLALECGLVASRLARSGNKRANFTAGLRRLESAGCWTRVANERRLMSDHKFGARPVAQLF